MGRHSDLGNFLAMMIAFVWMMGVLGGQNTPKEVQVETTTQKSMSLEEEMSSAGITCADCPNIPDGTVRVYSYTLPNGTVLETPNLSYVEFIEEKCAQRKERHARQKCQQHIATVRHIRPQLADTLDPVYGGTPNFTPEMNRRLVWYSNGAKANLKSAEDIAVGTKRMKFTYEKYYGTWPS